MSLAERCCCTCGVVLAVLVAPAEAAAHGGRSAPVASDFQARIDGIRPPSDEVEAKVVDGDQALWLDANGNATVLVPGAVGEPLLRFGPSGVYLNLRSPTAQADRIDTLDLRPDPNPQAAPLWHRLTSGPDYRWHDHRLHALAPLAHSHPRRWSVPLVIEGRHHRLAGTLVYRSPAAAWPWILLACALAAGALAGPLVAAPTATALVWTVRVGRELYGRPDVGASGYAEIVLTSLVGTALLAGLFNRDAGVRWFVALLVAVGCLYQGVTMLPVLTHSIALTALPTRLAQAAVAAILGLGGGLSVVSIRQQLARE